MTPRVVLSAGESASLRSRMLHRLLAALVALILGFAAAQEACSSPLTADREQRLTAPTATDEVLTLPDTRRADGTLSKGKKVSRHLTKVARVVKAPANASRLPGAAAHAAAEPPRFHRKRPQARPPKNDSDLSD